MPEITKRIKSELLVWAYYFFASFVATTIAQSSYEHAQLPLGETASTPQEPNIEGILVSLWHEYYKSWLLVFLGLSILRFLILIIIGRLKQGKTK